MLTLKIRRETSHSVRFFNSQLVLTDGRHCNTTGSRREREIEDYEIAHHSNRMEWNANAIVHILPYHVCHRFLFHLLVDLIRRRRRG